MEAVLIGLLYVVVVAVICYIIRIVMARIPWPDAIIPQIINAVLLIVVIICLFLWVLVPLIGIVPAP